MPSRLRYNCRATRWRNMNTHAVSNTRLISLLARTSTHPRSISNRPSPRLETHPTYTKHRAGPISNRPYFANLFSPSTSNPPAPAAISNRYNKLLEIPLSYRKHTAAPRSNRYKLRVFPAPFAAVNRFAVPAFPPKRVSPRRCPSRTSNRNTKLLESPLTDTKQSLAPLSNRNKIAFIELPYSAAKGANIQ